MSNFLMFWMLVALTVHTFWNFLGGVYSTVKAKLAGTTVAADVGSVEAFVGHVIAAVLAWFKSL